MSRCGRLVGPGILTVALIAGLAVGAPAPAAADWLVMDDGSRVETDGPWTLEGGGRLVVFTRPDGTLASLRASKVDLDASEAATREAKQPPRESVEEPERRESVARLTEAELPNAGRLVRREPDSDDTEDGAVGEETEGDPSAAASGDAPAASPGDGDDEVGVNDSGLEVTTWSDVSTVGGNGTELFGAIENVSEDTVAQIGLDIVFYDENDEVLFQGAGTVTANSIPTGRRVNFRVVAPGVYSYDRVELVPRGVRLATRP